MTPDQKPLKANVEAAAKSAQVAKWREENREAFKAYDAHIEAKGVFSMGKRVF